MEVFVVISILVTIFIWRERVIYFETGNRFFDKALLRGYISHMFTCRLIVMDLINAKMSYFWHWQCVGSFGCAQICSILFILCNFLGDDQNCDKWLIVDHVCHIGNGLRNEHLSCVLEWTTAFFVSTQGENGENHICYHDKVRYVLVSWDISLLSSSHLQICRIKIILLVTAV